MELAPTDQGTFEILAHGVAVGKHMRRGLFVEIGQVIYGYCHETLSSTAPSSAFLPASQPILLENHGYRSSPSVRPVRSDPAPLSFTDIFNRQES